MTLEDFLVYKNKMLSKRERQSVYTTFHQGLEEKSRKSEQKGKKMSENWQRRHGDLEVFSSCQGILDSSVPRSTAIANEIPVWKNGPSLLSTNFSPQHGQYAVNKN